MTNNPLYKLKNLADIPYLLSIGQNLADMKRSLKLNETGAFIYSQLSSGKSTDELIDVCAEHFEVDKNDEAFRSDIKAFADSLISSGVILTDNALPDLEETVFPNESDADEDRSGSDFFEDIRPFGQDSVSVSICIAGIHIKLEGHKELIPKEFELFYESSAESPLSLTEKTPDILLNEMSFPESPLAKMNSDTSHSEDIFSKQNTNTPYPQMTVRIINGAPVFQHTIPPLDSSVYGYCSCARCNNNRKIRIGQSSKNRQLPNISEQNPSPAKLLINHPSLTVFEEKETYAIYFHDAPSLFLMRCKKDGSGVLIYCDEKKDEETRLHLFHAIRMPFLLYAAQNGYIMLHSASLLYKDKAWLFSAPSGTGKSTHTNLWKKLWDTRLINGDLNLIYALPSNTDKFMSNALHSENRLSGINPKQISCQTSDKPVFYVCGTPWCGTSGICDNEKHELGGIIFLKQALSNFCTELTPDERRLNIFQRLITPMWKEEMLDNVLSMIENIADNIYIRKLSCTPDDEAAIIMRENIRK